MSTKNLSQVHQSAKKFKNNSSGVYANLGSYIKPKNHYYVTVTIGLMQSKADG